MSWREVRQDAGARASCFPTIWRSGSGRRVRPKRPWSRGTRIWRRLCRRAWKKFYSTISMRCTRARSRKHLCLAGGVAFNCVANGKIFDRTPFERVFVQPAAGDAGLAVGAAFYVYHQVLGQPRDFVMKHSYWGPGYSRAADPHGDRRAAIWLRPASQSPNCPKRNCCGPPRSASPTGDILGWFSGRAEWGPRALGNRSILADPRRAEMKDILNRRIKHREIFRPFAPSILAEATGEFFETSHPSPFMTFAYRGAPGKTRRAGRADARGRHRRACKPSSAKPIRDTGG